MAPYEALYGRKCRSPIHWDKMGERKFLGPELVQRTGEAVEKIRKRNANYSESIEELRTCSMNEAQIQSQG